MTLDVYRGRKTTMQQQQQQIQFNGHSPSIVWPFVHQIHRHGERIGTVR